MRGIVWNEDFKKILLKLGNCIIIFLSVTKISNERIKKKDINDVKNQTP